MAKIQNACGMLIE